MASPFSRQKKKFLSERGSKQFMASPFSRQKKKFWSKGVSNLWLILSSKKKKIFLSHRRGGKPLTQRKKF